MSIRSGGALLLILGSIAGIGCAQVDPDPLPLASAVCQAGYAGPGCTQCAAGYQDRNGNGFCAPTCVASSCGEHERCDDASGRPVCRCVVGYLRDSENSDNVMSADCVFRGGPADPSFSANLAGYDASPWHTTGAVYIDPSVSTQKIYGRDQGWAVFFGNGASWQEFDMPSFAESEPLAMELVAGCPNGGCANVDDASLAIMFGDRGFDIRLQGIVGRLIRQHICLGDIAYGRRVSLAAKTASAFSNFEDENVALDHLHFEPDAKCPAPGMVANGNFEGRAEGDESWISDLAARNGSIVDHAGTNGSSAGKLQVGSEQGCEWASLTSKISVPEKLAHPALSFAVRGAAHVTTSIALRLTDHITIGKVRNTGLGAPLRTAIMCLPEWTRGFTYDLILDVSSMDNDACKTVDSSVVVDDFTVTSDASCPDDNTTTTTIINGGFEAPTQALTQAGWDTYGASVVVDRAAAHSGDSFLRLMSGCKESSTTQWIFVRRGLSRPAVRFWYRQPGASSSGALSGVSVVLGNSYSELSRATEWTERVICVPSSKVGRPLGLRFSAWPVNGDSSDSNGSNGSRGSSGSSGSSFVDELKCDHRTLDVDDVSIVSDPSCPLE